MDLRRSRALCAYLLRTMYMEHLYVNLPVHNIHMFIYIVRSRYRCSQHVRCYAAVAPQ